MVTTIVCKQDIKKKLIFDLLCKESDAKRNEPKSALAFMTGLQKEESRRVAPPVCSS